MEFSKETLDGLVTAGDVAAISDSSFRFIFQRVLEVAKCSVSSGDESAIENGKCKSVFAGLLTFVLEAARHDSSTSSISSVLEDCKFEQGRINLFLSKYEESKPFIQDRLSRLGKRFPHVVDADWRQDYVIKTNNCEKVCEPSYIISLKLENMDSRDDVTFSCSIEQLQDLVLKLKDATKCVERNASH